MTDTKDPGEKKPRTPAKPTLSLKRSEAGTVRQSFSHGRTKTVVVETVKRRTPGSAGVSKEAKVEVAPPKPAPKPAAAPAPRPAATQDSSSAKSGVVLRTLTDEERDARGKALKDARVREEQERRDAVEEAKRRAEREAVEKVEREAAEARKKEEDSRRLHDEETKKKAEQEARKRFGDDSTAARPATGAGRAIVPDEEEENRPRRPGAKAPTPPRPMRTGGEARQRGRLTLTNALSTDEERQRSTAAFRRRTQRITGHRDEPKEKFSREIVIPETITIQELAGRMAERSVDVVKLLMKQGQMKLVTDLIDADTAQLIAEEMGHTVKRVAASDVVEGLFDAPDAEDSLKSRPPVVTIMGHVDHGKTSLLDAIRQTNVVAGEAGGITQHIGAYQVQAPSGAKITFIDTPGHAAFTAMRARGAKVTDIVILVVAADDGVKPQTIEAIQHAKAAKVPMIVAINKIDKPDAKAERVRTELLQHEVQVESMGGDVLDVEVSATKKTNLDKLLEVVGLQAEILELKANPDRPAEGTVIEAKLDKGRGTVATVLVQRGTLKVGDIILAGAEWGRVRALVSDKGAPLKSAGPSTPVEILGFNGTPEAGDRLAAVESEARAREIADYRRNERRDKAAAKSSTVRGSLEQMMSQLKTSGAAEFPLVIKGDAQGSVEAISGALEKLGTDEVKARVLLTGVGGITESDVTLAASSNAAIIGFNVRAHKEAAAAAERAGIEIRYYNIIYDLVDDVKAAMSGLLAPELRETMLGNAEVLEVFAVSKVGKIAGCRVTDGRVERGANVRLIRDKVVIHEGKLATLKRFKDDVNSVVAGQECGMSFEGYQDMRKGDVIECYRVESIARAL
ncbi:MAG TPA: translation initiation factor IF-2 [Xanthobacteraceae bacterium]|nr:translation initiation factor IF-2 [Xanthobacteraceae bacterium]